MTDVLRITEKIKFMVNFGVSFALGCYAGIAVWLIMVYWKVAPEPTTYVFLGVGILVTALIYKIFDLDDKLYQANKYIQEQQIIQTDLSYKPKN